MGLTIFSGEPKQQGSIGASKELSCQCKAFGNLAEVALIPLSLAGSVSTVGRAHASLPVQVSMYCNSYQALMLVFLPSYVWVQVQTQATKQSIKGILKIMCARDYAPITAVSG